MEVFNEGEGHSKRNLIGYGQSSAPRFAWPNGARVCISFVLNYEEGAENTRLNDGSGNSSSRGVARDEPDKYAESFLTENGVTPTVLPPLADRELSRESTYAYGSRVGFWRILAAFKASELRFTSWACGKAVELNPDVVPAMEAAGCEVASHGYRWINYANVPEANEREHISKTIDVLAAASPTHRVPMGWYTGRCSTNTRRLVHEEYTRRGLAERYYDNDSYDDDLPYYIRQGGSTSVLVLPYTLDVNDMKFAIAPGFSTADHFYSYAASALETLLLEAYGEDSSTSASSQGKSAMMTIGLHCRIIGRPGRFAGLRRLLKECQQLQAAGKVWVATRSDIADFWRSTFPPQSHPA